MVKLGIKLKTRQTLKQKHITSYVLENERLSFSTLVTLGWPREANHPREVFQARQTGLTTRVPLTTVSQGEGMQAHSSTLTWPVVLPLVECRHVTYRVLEKAP